MLFPVSRTWPKNIIPICQYAQKLQLVTGGEITDVWGPGLFFLKAAWLPTPSGNLSYWDRTSINLSMFK
jgi:hypothetical protein